MFCLACDRKLPKIKEDNDYKNWGRKYHKKCLKECGIYLDILNKIDKNDRHYSYYRKRACLA